MRSDIASAGVYSLHQPGGDEDVLGGVDVSVVPSATAGTRPLSRPKGERGKKMPTCATGFRTRIPAVDDHNAAAGTFGLVFEHGPKLAPPGPADRLCQTPVADHIPGCEVFYRDGVEPLHQIGGDLLQEVTAGIPNTGVLARELHSLSSTISGPFPHPCHTPLMTKQTTFMPNHMLGIGDLVSSGESGEVLDAEIYTDRIFRRHDRRQVGLIHCEGDKPTAIRLQGYDHHRRAERGQVDVWPCPYDPQRCHGLGQPQPVGLDAERRTGKVCRLAAMPVLEPWVASTPFEKGSERIVLVPESLLQGYTTDLRQECQFPGALPLRQRGISFLVGSRLSSNAVALFRSDRVLFQTTRTQPNVRRKSAACPTSG